MTTVVGTFACGVLALVLAMQQPAAAPLWTLPPLDITATWRYDERVIRHNGDRLPVRHHDGRRGVWSDSGVHEAAFLAPPSVYDARALPVVGAVDDFDPDPDDADPDPAWEDDEPDVDALELDTVAPVLDDAALSLRLDLIETRLHLALSAQLVSVCARMLDPVSVPSTGKHKKGKRHESKKAQSGGSVHRGRRRVRGGVLVRST